MARSGDKCEQCAAHGDVPGRFVVVSSRPKGTLQEQHLRCPKCGYNPGKAVVLAESIRRRVY